MYQEILLGTDGSVGANVATDYAVWLAHKLKARLRALHVTDVRLLEGPLLADMAGALGAQPYSALLPQLQRIQEEKAQTVLRAVAARCEAEHVPCTLLHQTGGLTHVLLEQEQPADLVVLGRRGEHAQWAWEALGSSVERMVRASVRPCLVCPETFQPITHVLLAYDGSDESTKAVRTAITLAEMLAARLTIVTAYEKDEQREAATKVLEQARLQVANRKLPVATHLLAQPAEQAILGSAVQSQADLIVMGAYGHTRIREFIIGSTTTQVMRHAKVPVLLSRNPR